MQSRFDGVELNVATCHLGNASSPRLEPPSGQSTASAHGKPRSFYGGNHQGDQERFGNGFVRGARRMARSSESKRPDARKGQWFARTFEEAGVDDFTSAAMDTASTGTLMCRTRSSSRSRPGPWPSRSTGAAMVRSRRATRRRNKEGCLRSGDCRGVDRSRARRRRFSKKSGGFHRHAAPIDRRSRAAQ